MKTGSSLFFGSVLVLALSAVSCSSDNATNANDPVTGDFTSGTSTTYRVNSGTAVTSVQDTAVTGATFTVVPGSGAALTIAPVTSGPALPVEGKRFVVEYSGNPDITIKLPVSDGGDDETLLFYGPLEHAAIDDIAGNVGWWGLQPSGEKDGFREYSVTLATTAAAKSMAGKTKINAFARAKQSSVTGGFGSQVETVIDTWIINLPEGMREEARQKVVKVPYTVVVSDGNAYSHVAGLFSGKVTFYFKPKAEMLTFAHEVGHYMTHVLCGYDRYDELYSRFPTDFWGSAVEHDMGSYREGRKEILEDFPYISMLMVTGEVDRYDIMSVAKLNNVRDMTDNADPSKVDYPSHEGFGAAMLAALLRTHDTIYTFTKTKGQETAAVPVAGASWGDVLSILAKGPRDQNELRSLIQEYLDSRGGEYRFMYAPMMEPLGWSYHGSGKIVDDKGNAVKNAVVQCIVQTGTKEYRTPESSPSGADGSFTLTRIFPGANIMRVFFNARKDSLDFPLGVDWEQATNKAVEIGKITLGESLSTRTLTLSRIEEIKYDETTVIARVTVNASFEVTAYSLEPHSIQTTAGLYMVAGMPVRVNATATCMVEMVNAHAGGTSWYSEYAYGQPSFVFQPQKYGTFVIDESRNGGNYTGQFIFPGGGDMLHIKFFIRLPQTEKRYGDGELLNTYTGDRYIDGPTCYLYAK